MDHGLKNSKNRKSKILHFKIFGFFLSYMCERSGKKNTKNIKSITLDGYYMG